MSLVAAAAFMALVLVVTVAAAGLAMLVGVLVVMTMAVARGLAVLCERSGDERLDTRIAAALGAGIDGDARLGERVDGAAADTAADERVHAPLASRPARAPWPVPPVPTTCSLSTLPSWMS